MFDVGEDDAIVRAKTGVSLNPRSPAASASLPLESKLDTQLLID